MKVWLDDVRKPPVGWEWRKTALEAIELLKSGEVRELSLDHDLEPEHYDLPIEENIAVITVGDKTDSQESENEDPYSRLPDTTGYSVCLWMAQNDVWPPIMYIHSASPPGRARMKSIIERYKPECSVLVMLPPGQHPPTFDE